MTMYHNAVVFTGTSTDALATSFSVADGVFTSIDGVGDASSSNDSVDLGGAFVMPGLLDVHTHPAFMATLADNVWLFPPAISSLDDMIAALREHPALGVPGAWVTAYGYNEDQWGGRGPTRSDLDLVSTTQPVFARRADGHNAVCNSFALALAGLDDSSPDPEGGKLGRDTNGHLDGRLIETNGVDQVYHHMPLPDRDELVRRLVGLNKHFLRFGLTSIDDLYGDFVPEPLDFFRTARARGFIPRVSVMLLWKPSAMPSLNEEDRTGDVRVGGVKIFMDGAFSSRTAWVEEPYPDSDSHGIVTIGDDAVRAACAWARDNQVQMAIHVMGDRGIAHLLDLFENEEPWLEDRPSIRFDHAAIVPQALLDRMVNARMSFAAISHSVFFFAEWDSYRENLTPSAWASAYPLRSFYERIPCALTSDAPATAWIDCDAPFLSIEAAVTRTTYDGTVFNADQALTVGQALEMYTSKASEVTMTRGVGRIAEGFDADFVVLDRNPFTANPTDLSKVSVVATYVRGQRVWG